jgi:acetyltransferase (GNAT) family protein
MKYQIKPPENESEFEQMFRLNHDVFAGELGQYPRAASGRLVDKFHVKNRYLVALAGGRVAGMIAFHMEPPFSVAGKLADPSILDGLGRLAEVRLLAIDPGHRDRMLLTGLLLTLFEEVRGYDAIAISGHVAECAMYAELGFRPLGLPVASGAAEFVPMAVKTRDLETRAARWRKRFERRSEAAQPVRKSWAR